MLGHRQKTLQQATPALTGLRLDEDRPATLRVHPAPPGSGIAFVRADLPGAPQVPCALANLREQSRWSALAVGNVWGPPHRAYLGGALRLRHRQRAHRAQL